MRPPPGPLWSLPPSIPAVGRIRGIANSTFKIRAGDDSGIWNLDWNLNSRWSLKAA